MLWFAHSRQRPWLKVADFVAPCVPTGLAAGRIGNFINGELWGRFSSADLPWVMVFRTAAACCRRDPSQLYQFLLEGLLLFALLWWYAKGPRKTGQVAAAFLVGYGSLRFVAEYFREPDDFLGLLAGHEHGTVAVRAHGAGRGGFVGVGQSVTKIIRAAGACRVWFID